MDNIQRKLEELFKKTFNEEVTEFSILPTSGSGRNYYRLKSNNEAVVGAYSTSNRENKAFFYFTDFFYSKSLPVPKLFSVHQDEEIYLQEDLGDLSLFQLVEKGKKAGMFSDELKSHYKKALRNLVDFQLANDFDGSYCYPRDCFDRQSMQWDLNYFKYYFLKLANIPFDEQYIEDDFQRLIAYIAEIDSNFFMYRDFQSRNILIRYCFIAISGKS